MYVVDTDCCWKGRYASSCCISLFPAALMKAGVLCFLKSYSVHVFLEATCLYFTYNSCLFLHKHLIHLSVFWHNLQCNFLPDGKNEGYFNDLT